VKTWITVLCAVAVLAGCVTNKPAVEAPKVVVDGHQLQFRGDFAYFEGQRFTGVAVKKYPNGQKSYEATWKDGKEHGLSTGWHENGQKWRESTYKDGKFISVKNWDEDGNPEVVTF
jgi:hypothetical protein